MESWIRQEYDIEAERMKKTVGITRFSINISIIPLSLSTGAAKRSLRNCKK